MVLGKFFSPNLYLVLSIFGWGRGGGGDGVVPKISFAQNGLKRILVLNFLITRKFYK